MCLVTAQFDHDGQVFTQKNLIKLNKYCCVQLIEFITIKKKKTNTHFRQY